MVLKNLKKMKKLLKLLGFHLDNPNEYTECPRCKEWAYQDSHCNECGYSRD